MKQKIVITGANGFIGHHLINYLSNYDFEIFALIRENSLPKFKLKRNIHIYYGEINNTDVLKKLVQTNSTIINLAANPYHPTLSRIVNVEGLKKLLKVARDKKIKRFMQMSSQATKLKLKGVYGQTKQEADELIINSDLDYIILKPSLVYGPGETGLFSRLKKQLKNNAFIPIFGTKNILINPIFIEDLNYFVKKILDDTNTKNLILEPGTSKFITYEAFYKEIANQLNIKVNLVYLPKSFGFIIAKIFSLLKNPPFTKDNVLGSSQSTNPDPFPIIKKYKFNPRDFKTGVRDTFNPDTIKVAIIGGGKMGTLHSTVLSSFPDTQVKAFVEPNIKLHPTIKSMLKNIKIYQSVTELFKNESKIDAVFITTPNFTHFNLIQECLKKNSNIFIEKPVTINSSQAGNLKKNTKNLIIHTGYTLLFDRTFRKAKEIINGNQFGLVKSFKAVFEHSEVLENKKGWMFEKKLSGGGVLINPGPHLISLIYYLFGNPTKIKSQFSKIYSQTVEDTALLNFTFNKFSGTALLNWSIPNRLTPLYEIEIVFDKAIITINSSQIKIKTKTKVQIIKKSDITLTDDNIFNINPQSYGENYYLEDRQFIDCIKNKDDSNKINSLKEALAIEEIIFKSYQNEE